jgi:hypothetical protein
MTALQEARKSTRWRLRAHNVDVVLCRPAEARGRLKAATACAWMWNHARRRIVSSVATADLTVCHSRGSKHQDDLSDVGLLHKLHLGCGDLA